jgi:hypothetical protein
MLCNSDLSWSSFPLRATALAITRTSATVLTSSIHRLLRSYATFCHFEHGSINVRSVSGSNRLCITFCGAQRLDQLDNEKKKKR